MAGKLLTYCKINELENAFKFERSRREDFLWSSVINFRRTITSKAFPISSGQSPGT